MRKKNIKRCFLLSLVMMLSFSQSIAHASDIQTAQSTGRLSRQAEVSAINTGVDITLISDSLDPNEGIYYIVNKATGKYLTVDSNDNPITTSSYNDTSQWVFKYYEDSTSGHLFKLINDANDGYLGQADAISLYTEYSTKMIDSGNGQCCFHNYGDNTYTLRFNDTYDMFMLRSTASSNTTTWFLHDSSDVTPYDQWYLYKVNYSLGDVDKDGTISATDANLIQRYNVKLETFTETQKYLADVNEDDIIDSSDALAVLNIVVGNQ